jgi:hypothetical protein
VGLSSKLLAAPNATMPAADEANNCTAVQMEASLGSRGVACTGTASILSRDAGSLQWVVKIPAVEYQAFWVKPLTVFGAIGVLLVVAGLIPGSIVILEFIRTRFITHVPSAVLAVGLVLSGLITGMAGLVFHTVVRRFQELDLQVRFLDREFSGTSREDKK